MADTSEPGGRPSAASTAAGGSALSRPPSSGSGLRPESRGESVSVEGYTRDAFITALKDSNERRDDASDDPEGMTRVRRLHGQLMSVVKSLNKKVETVLQKQEGEFLSAYRGHMYTVQKELQSWKDKADAARLRQERDAKMERLQEECAWFRKEALRLNKFTNALKRDLQMMREQLEALEEDRDWLERQLKASKKDNKLLRAELELRVAMDHGDGATAGRGAGGALDDGDSIELPGRPQRARRFAGGAGGAGGRSLASEAFEAGDGGDDEAEAARLGWPGTSGGGGGGGHDRPLEEGSDAGWGSARADAKVAPSLPRLAMAGAGRSAVAAPRKSDASSSSSSSASAAISPAHAHVSLPAPEGMTLVAADKLQRLEAQVEQLRAQLATERGKLRQLRTARQGEESRRSELEEVFAACVEEVRRGSTRKGGSVGADGSSSLSGGASGGLGGGGGSGGVSKPARGILTDLSASDRRAVVQRLLEDDFVLESLHRLIFRSGGSSGTGGGGGGGGGGGLGAGSGLVPGSEAAAMASHAAYTAAVGARGSRPMAATGPAGTVTAGSMAAASPIATGPSIAGKRPGVLSAMGQASLASGSRGPGPADLFSGLPRPAGGVRGGGLP